jgi:predicted GNAT family N-acyltransferase
MKIENGKSFVEFSVDSMMIDEDTEKEYILINLIYTAPEARGQGVARKMLTEAVAEIGKNFPGMEVKLCALPKEDSVDMDRLVDFYKSVGFRVDDEQNFAGVFMTYTR